MGTTVDLDCVRKAYDSTVAVENLSFALNSGEVFGLLGPNGAGKTSTIRMMIGIVIPDSGAVRIFGNPISRAALRRVGYLPEERGLFRRMTVRDNLMLLGELAGLGASDALRRAREWTARLGLEEWISRRVEELSRGMQQKIQFAAALIHEPDLIVLDEPFSGLDPVNANSLKEILLELKREGRTIVLSTHRMDHAEKLCDAICLVDHGRVVVEGGLREIKSNYGKRFVQIEYQGPPGLLADSPLIDSRNDYGNYLEVGLKPGADSQELLREVSAAARLSRFELMEPSLEQIFIDRVGRRDA